MIRSAATADIPILRELERAAGKPFADIGMTAVAEDEPPSADTLREFVEAGRAWVWIAAGTPVAYLIAAVVDGNAHIEQVSVHPAHRGERIGRRLIDHAMNWTRDKGLPAITLTTFTEVPWNGPYYETLGFRYLDIAEETPGLRAIRAAEDAHGLDHWPRACMRAEVY
ncbi:GNAT family N-acetyltransferase [Nocardia donostiensis]|uniref:GNAT family N-acetyltransferase n=1 Tax=Nocardia donostiensis TaxID=1538463 RepID=A0A1W0BKY5_9NOCA|nr:GNAT family N-acetyltransferase [Nocardia donostiensis]ONM46535.1 GNAT family N-acetyltransferase [Nocardia donostiensis]OQS16712.1 GNAT family N-acetyltransferase [Nocardia donostiensis]OQS23175.1 GNAT family N-acetyltransferase [Nocardia donostiensis]